MSSVYISPIGSGSQDGTSAANAAGIGKLPSLVAKAGPGGSILILADQGSYTLANPIMLTGGGTSAAPVTIKGIDSHGNAMDAQFIGTRAENWSSGAAVGQDAFRLLSGADNISFENLTFKNVANAIRVGADISNLNISHVTAQNVSRFLEDYASGNNSSATISGLKIDAVTVNGYAESVVRLQYDTHDVVIMNTVGDSQGIDGAFAMGVHLHGTVHDVLLSYVTMKNNVYSGSAYWNGDGFATESGVSNVRFEHTIASGNADAGYDIKSSSTVLDGVLSEGNNRNYRFWNDDTVLTNARGLESRHLGGTGSSSEVWLADNAKVRISNSQFSDHNGATTIFNLDQSHSTIVLDNVAVAKGETTKLSRLFDGSNIQGEPTVVASIDAETPPSNLTNPRDQSATAGVRSHEVYRFYDTKTGDHFYTTSAAEKQLIQQTISWYNYEGVSWNTPSDGPNTIDVFRFFDTKTNQHFFTTSVGERDNILQTLPTYHYEGVAFEAYADASAAGSSSVTLERFYNTQTGLHHYAANAVEAYGINHGSAGAGWVDEGKAFVVHTPTEGMLSI